jgi:hypothetical protein
METRLWCSCRTVELKRELWCGVIVQEMILDILLWGRMEASWIEQGSRGVFLLRRESWGAICI